MARIELYCWRFFLTRIFGFDSLWRARLRNCYLCYWGHEYRSCKWAIIMYFNILSANNRLWHLHRYFKATNPRRKICWSNSGLRFQSLLHTVRNRLNTCATRLILRSGDRFMWNLISYNWITLITIIWIRCRFYDGPSLIHFDQCALM